MTDSRHSVPGRTPRRELPLIVAAASTGLVACALIGVAITVMAARLALFSVGIGIVLLLYGVLVAFIGWSTWRRSRWVFGALVACALLHLLVSLNLARGTWAPLFLGIALVPLTTVICAFLPSTRRALGRMPAAKTALDK